MGPRRWQDWCNLAFGAWLFLTPLLFGYDPDVPLAAVNAYLMGGAIIALSAAAVSMPEAWEEPINVAIGIWLLCSPWVLGFTPYHDEAQTAGFVGLGVTVLATWAMLRDRKFQKWWHDHHFVHH